MEVLNTDDQKKCTLDVTLINEAAAKLQSSSSVAAGPSCPALASKKLPDGTQGSGAATTLSSPPRNPIKAGILTHGKQREVADSELNAKAGAKMDASTKAGEDWQHQASAESLHQRKVSWEDAHLGSGIPTFLQPSGALKPNLTPPRLPPLGNARRTYSEDFSTGLGSPYVSPKLSFLTQPQLGSSKSTHSNADRSPVVVNLNDVLNVNPLESEAETLILQAIELQEESSYQEIRAGSSTRSSNLFGNIPADSVDLFKKPSAETEVGDQGSNAAMNHRRPGSVADGSVKADPQKLPQQRLRKRTVTMEQTLASLSRAIAIFHQADGPEDDSANRNRGVNEVVQSAGEVFARNANLVLRFRPKPKISAREELASTALRKTIVGSSGEMDYLVQNDSSRSAKAAKWWSPWRSAVASKKVGERHEKTAKLATVNSPTNRDDIECGSPETKGSGSDASRCGVEVMSNKKGSRKTRSKGDALNKDFKDLQIFMGQLRETVKGYLRGLLMVTCPAMAIAFILYYCVGEPICAL